MNKNINQRGAVSLFVVIFTALLITVVTVSFVRIMIQGQQQATAADLSRSAYDSAQAGVEDAKRALLLWQTACNTDSASTNCIDLTNILMSSNQECNAAVKELTDVSDASSGNEIKIQNGSTGNVLNQAYTCVKITPNTTDVQGYLGKDESEFIPLKVKALDSFDRIRIEWFSQKDLIDLSKGAYIPDWVVGSPPLLNQWVSPTVQNRPSIMRTQLIQFDPQGFKLTDFDDIGAEGSNNTIFLYPSKIIDTTKSFIDIPRKTISGGPVQVHCNDLNNSESYACSAYITLPSPVTNNNHIMQQYLNLTSLYRSSNYRVTLYLGNGPTATPVKFDNVQPSIDSTGRADDLFRRVQTRVKLTTDFPYPGAAVDITGNLCKDFFVTNNAEPGGGYNPGTCTP